MSDEFWNTQIGRLESELDFLEDKPEETPQSTLKALWLAADGAPCSAEEAAGRLLSELDEKGKQLLENMMERRLAGEPLSYIIGRQSFMGLEFIAAPEAMIPRKETEILAVAVLELIDGFDGERRDVQLIDVCTGSGNMPVTFASKRPGVKVSAADLSADAVVLAKKNAVLHGVADNIDFRQGDLLEPFAQDDYMGAVDIISCNPPYISSGGLKSVAAEIVEHEPKMAFSAGVFGVDIINRLVEMAPKFLKPETGKLCFEVGAGQGPFFLQRLEKNSSFRKMTGITDENDEIRVICAEL